MDVDTSLKVLVIILSVMLALFLTLGIVLTIKAIQLINRLKYVVDKAAELTDKAGHMADFFKNTSGAAAIGKLLANMHHQVFGKRKQSKE